MADLAEAAALSTETADVVIVGGGPVGSALALALQLPVCDAAVGKAR